ncbi:MAG: co-chaperone GroES [Pseudomonadota bacterium]|nr:co-chaperone GroES [Pseudomonadota bacterium]
MMIRPLRDRVIVKPVPRIASEIIEVILNEKPNVGEVMAVGPGKVDGKGHIHPLDLKVGQKVRFGEFVFPEYHEDGQKYLVLQEADIAGIVED